MPTHHKAFVSSTYVDLKEHRAHVIRALEKAGFYVDPMEKWTADTQEPKLFSQQRVDGCDLCVLLVAFRRGFVPDGETLSITQLEHQYADEHGIDVLPFLLDAAAAWYSQYDERRDDPGIDEWRAALMNKYGVGRLALDPRSVEIEPAISRWLRKQVQEPDIPSKPDLDVPVVPKGLRSFDAKDQDFFLQLVPGSRDKDGLPQSIRFWKHRIETSQDNPLTIGLIWGPSGCGKSSLVKAGLLPRLASHVVSVYLEATAEGTEQGLFSRLRRACPDLPGDCSLQDALSALSQGQGLPDDKKLVIVLDQFEQWLHGRPIDDQAELVQTLRHCDGRHVQCVVMVRDDFWTAATRFMELMDVEIRDGHSSALVDLFDKDHARKVLASFGQAYGKVGDDD